MKRRVVAAWGAAMCVVLAVGAGWAQTPPAGQTPPAEQTADPGGGEQTAGEHPGGAGGGEQPGAAAPEGSPGHGAHLGAPGQPSAQGGGPGEPPTGTPEAEAQGDLPEQGQMTAAQYGEVFRRVLRAVEPRVLASMERKRQAKAGSQLGLLTTILCSVPWLGLLLVLILPLVYARRFPGKTGALVKGSLVSAGAFVVVAHLFGAVLLVLRLAQGALAGATDPMQAIVKGAFHTLDKNVEVLVALGPQLIEPTLRQVLAGANGEGDGNVVVALLENGQRFAHQVRVFIDMAKFFKSFSGVLALVPYFMAFLAVALFFLSAKGVFVDIVRLPAEVAGGAEGAVKRVLKDAMKRIGRELLATLCQIVALIAVTLIVGLFLGELVKPAVDALLAEIVLALLYVQIVPGASGGLIMAGFLMTILFLALNVVISILASTFFLAKTAMIFKDRFHSGVPFRAHKRFWKWGLPAIGWALLLPLGYVHLADWIVGKIATSMVESHPPKWSALFIVPPLVLVLGWGLVFWALRGVKAVTWLARYKLVAAPVVAPTAAATAA